MLVAELRVSEALLRWGWWGRRRQAVGADEVLRVLLTMAPTEFRGPFGVSRAVDTRARHDTTPLMAACLNNHPMAVRALIAEGANTRLTCEVQHGLVTHNWKVRARPSRRRSLLAPPLSPALVAQILVMLGHGCSALHMAAARGAIECCWELVTADPGLLAHRNQNGATAEEVAGLRHQHETARFLRSLSVDHIRQQPALAAASALSDQLRESLALALAEAPLSAASASTRECGICFEEDVQRMVAFVPCRCHDVAFPSTTSLDT